MTLLLMLILGIPVLVILVRVVPGLIATVIALVVCIVLFIATLLESVVRFLLRKPQRQRSPLQGVSRWRQTRQERSLRNAVRVELEQIARGSIPSPRLFPDGIPPTLLDEESFRILSRLVESRVYDPIKDEITRRSGHRFSLTEIVDVIRLQADPTIVSTAAMALREVRPDQVERVAEVYPNALDSNLHLMVATELIGFIESGLIVTIPGSLRDRVRGIEAGPLLMTERPRRCPSCGKVAMSADRFCHECGTALV